MIKVIFKIILFLITVVAIFAIYNYKTLNRVNKVIHLFDEDVIVQNFQNMDEFTELTVMNPSSKPYQWDEKLTYSLPDTFYYKDSMLLVDQYLEQTITEGLLIMQRDTIIYEQYFNDLQKNETHISWSVSKSLVSTMMGILHDNGAYNLMDPITDYLPELIGTGYENVPIKHILQMSSGIKYNEDYSEFNSDINRFGRAFAMGTPLIDFLLSLESERDSGTYNHYVSMDTQVLGFLIRKLSGQTITEFTQENIWEPMGMESQGEWIIDNTGMEMVLGGLNATLRDYAKLGMLYLNEGKYKDNQVVSAEWVKMSITPDAPHLMPNQKQLSSNHHGYGFQWWIPQYDEGDYFAGGIYNQYIYVHPEKDLVITKLSANHHYKNQKQITKDIHIALFKSIANGLLE